MTPEDPQRPRRGGVGSRREARERAIALLYEADIKGIEPAAVLGGLPVDAEPYAAELVAGVGARLPEIDELITSRLRDWRLERLPVIDRAVLRVGVYELLARPDVPTGVVLAEAVQLAAEYSGDESGRFVNGVLAAVGAALRGPDDEVLGAEAPASR